MNFDLFRKFCKYPFIWEGALYDGKILGQNKNCRNCKSLDCLNLISTNNVEYICSQGFNSFGLALNEGKVIFNGLITTDNKIIKQGRKNARIAYLFHRGDLHYYFEELSDMSDLIDEGITKNIEEKFTLFHDVRSSYSIAFSNLEKIILKADGSTFNEKLQNCEQEIIDLYDSLELVNNQLDLIDVMVNPKAITQGNKREFNLFKLTHKLMMLLKPKAAKRELTIEWRTFATIPGGTYHDSIKLIPIILIENAIKYSEEVNRIMIYFNYDGSKIQISFSSYGIAVPLSERQLIFDKQARGSNAKEYTNEGLGMGLYIAKRILARHNGTISYEFDHKGHNFGFNIFKVEV